MPANRDARGLKASTKLHKRRRAHTGCESARFRNRSSDAANCPDRRWQIGNPTAYNASGIW
jgi:hypothetical protein